MVINIYLAYEKISLQNQRLEDMSKIPRGENLEQDKYFLVKENIKNCSHGGPVWEDLWYPNILWFICDKKNISDPVPSQ